MKSLVAVTFEGGLYQLMPSTLFMDKLQPDVMRTYQVVQHDQGRKTYLLRPSLPSGTGEDAAASFRQWAEAQGYEVREVLSDGE